MLGWALVVAAPIVVAGAPAEPVRAPAEDARLPSAREVLGAAFENFYGCDVRASIEMVTRSGLGAERRRRLDIATKNIDGRRHRLARVSAPPYLRGMAFLTMERGDGHHDAFIYLPSLGRVRRVSAAQRHDPFLGSDLTHEDMERRRVEDYELAFLPPERIGGELAHVVGARPRMGAAYDRLQILVAQADAAMLEIRYFKRDAASPYRVIRMPRSSMQEEKGHVLPTRIEVEGRGGGSVTELVFHDLEIEPELEARIFEPSWLARDRSGPIAHP